MYSLVGQDPSNGSTLNAADTLIFFSIITDGFLDSSKLYVNVGTEPAIDSGSFTDRYNGLNSEIVIDENLTSITIQRDESFELGKNVSLNLNPGDAILYKGCERPHWRGPMPGKKRNFIRKLFKREDLFYHQIFFHYVLANGNRAHYYNDFFNQNT